MRGNNTSDVGSIIRKIMKNPKLANRMDILDALCVWNDLIGKDLQKFILSAKIYKGNLHIKLSSSALRNELSYQKTELIQKINSNLGKEIVKDIILK